MADLNQLVNDLSALTILEAAELKKMLEEKWGVTAAAAAPMMVAAPGAAAGAAPAAAEPPEEKTEFTVVITDVGPKKINVIKAVRTVTNLGLKEAKELVESEKPTVLEAVSKEVAEDAKKKLEEEGAKVEIK